MPRFFDIDDYRKNSKNVLTYKDIISSRDTQLTLGWSENMVNCFNSSERIQQINRSEFYVNCEIHTEEYNKTHGCFCSCANQTPCERIISNLYDATIIEINNNKYILSKFICSTKNGSGQSWQSTEKQRNVYNMKKALLFNYEPDFKPTDLNDLKNMYPTSTYKWYQVGSIDRITKEIIWEPNHEPKLEPSPVPIQEPSPVPVLTIEVSRLYIAGNYYLQTADKVLYDPVSMYEVGKWNSTLKAYNINKLQINKGKLDKNYKIINIKW
jgi:hypothetical protein